MNSIRLRRWVEYVAQSLGTTGLVGVVMIVLAALLWLGVVGSDQRELLRLQRTQASLEQQAQTRSQLPANSSLGREEQLAIFYQYFPAEGKLPDMLGLLYKAAQEQGLELETGEYARAQSNSERLARYRVTLPVKGSFKQVLAFMDVALKEGKAVALENAAFKRDKVDDNVVNARLTFVLMVDTQP